MLHNELVWMINLPKENQNCGNEWLKVDMSIVVGVGIENNVSKNLHPDNCIDEEKHPNQQDYIWKSLECDKSVDKIKTSYFLLL